MCVVIAGREAGAIPDWGGAVEGCGPWPGLPHPPHQSIKQLHAASSPAGRLRGKEGAGATPSARGLTRRSWKAGRARAPRSP